jgi:spore maturation protein CgeB
MRILLIYPGHSHSTIDVAAGYDRALKNLGHTVLAFNYHNQLAFYMEAVKYWMKRNKTFRPKDRDEAIMMVASEQVIVEVVDFVPDLILIVSGFALHRRAYDLMAKLCRPMVLILTESPYLDEEQTSIIQQGHIDLVFTNDKSSVIPLRETDKPVEYLPHSYDPYRHYKKVCMDKYDSDVFFFGTWWPERQRLFKGLDRWIKRQGYKPNLGGVSHSKKRGMISNQEMVRYYSSTKIALNHHRTVIGVEDGQEKHINGGAYSLGPRAFEIAACEAFQLCDGARSELFEVFGDTVGVYTGPDDLRDQLWHYLRFEDERKEMAQAAFERVKACSFENRATDILMPAIEAHL